MVASLRVLRIEEACSARAGFLEMTQKIHRIWLVISGTLFLGIMIGVYVIGFVGTVVTSYFINTGKAWLSWRESLIPFGMVVKELPSAFEPIVVKYHYLPIFIDKPPLPYIWYWQWVESSAIYYTGIILSGLILLILLIKSLKER